MQTLFSLFQGPTLAILGLGILWKRANYPGALCGLVGGVLVSASLNLIGGELFPGDDPFLFVAFWSFAFALVVTIGVSLATAPPTSAQTKGLVWGELGEHGDGEEAGNGVGNQ